MLRVAVGQAEGLDTRAVLAEVLEQCEAQLAGATPSAGILIVAGLFDQDLVTATIRRRYPALLLVGCGSQAVMSSPWGYGEDAIGLALIASDTITVRAGIGRVCSGDPQTAVARALAEARAGAPARERVCIAFTDKRSERATDVLRALAGALPPGCTLFGGAAGMPWGDLDGEPVQFFGDARVRDAVCVLLLSGPVEATYCVENSWSPVGELQRVTSSSGNHLFRIGDRTALEFYQHYLGPHSRPAFEFPLAVFETDDDSRYYLRIPASYDPETGAILYSGAIPEGARVQLTEVVRSRLLDQTGDTLRRAASSMSGAPAAAFVFSCAIRRQILGSKAGDEASIVRSSLGDAPMFGFYALGEIAPAAGGGDSVMHNSTLVAVLLRERGAAEAPVTTPTPAPAPAPTPTPRRAPLHDPAFIARKLARAEEQRARLEEYRELNNAMLRTIGAEIERSRQQIAAQNAELRRLNDALAREKQRSEELLHNILPTEVARELKRTGHVEPVHYDAVSVLFTDFKGFTRIASQLTPSDLLGELDYFFTRFDEIIDRHGLEKLKTIGDAYMAAGGIPRVSSTHALDTVAAAWDIQAFMRAENEARAAAGRTPWPLRVGINSGPLMAGVIGNKKFAYDIWGDTVNIASRLESSSEPGRINLSRATYEQVRGRFRCTPRGRLPVKNAGSIEMFFVDARLPAGADAEEDADG